MASTPISDDLWRQQNPAAAGLTRRTRRRLWIVAVTLLAAVIAAPVALHAGAFAPQVHAAFGGWNGEFVHPDGTTEPTGSGAVISSDVSGTADIINAGWSTVRVLDIRVTGAGFRFDHVTGRVGDADGTDATMEVFDAPPFTLAPNHTADLTLYFHITDCHAVAAAEQFATVRIDSWRGIQTVQVPLPTVRHDRGGWSVTGADDPQGVNSVRYLADAVCGIGMDPG